MKTKEDFLKEMETDNILLSDEYTFQEYAAEIIKFQQMICKLIAGEDYYDTMRVSDALYLMEAKARKMGVQGDPAVRNGIINLKKFAKEIAITMSGTKGEAIVSNTLKYLDRPNAQIFRNIYVTDGKEETELDEVILTEDGVLVLETKRVKSDLTLAEDGRMVFDGNGCYDKVPLCEKMVIKRELLKKHIEKIAGEKGLAIPVYVDSYIVFCTPKDKYIRVNDRYHKEKYCFRTNLNNFVKHYYGGAAYTDAHLEALGNILSEMEANKKRFKTELDYNEIRQSLAEALEVLQGEQHVPDKESDVVKDEKAVEAKPAASHPAQSTQARQQTIKKAIGWGSFAACLITGVVLSAGTWNNFTDIFRK